MIAHSTCHCIATRLLHLLVGVSMAACSQLTLLVEACILQVKAVWMQPFKNITQSLPIMARASQHKLQRVCTVFSTTTLKHSLVQTFCCAWYIHKLREEAVMIHTPMLPAASMLAHNQNVVSHAHTPLQRQLSSVINTNIGHTK